MCLAVTCENSFACSGYNAIKQGRQDSIPSAHFTGVAPISIASTMYQSFYINATIYLNFSFLEKKDYITGNLLTSACCVILFHVGYTRSFLKWRKSFEMQLNLLINFLIKIYPFKKFIKIKNFGRHAAVNFAIVT